MAEQRSSYTDAAAFPPARGEAVETDDAWGRLRDAWKVLFPDGAAPGEREGYLSAVEAIQELRRSEMNARSEVARLGALVNTPELVDFARAVRLEAVHQRERWGTDHDGGKTPADWFWLLGYLSGKALAAHLAGNHEKALHHTISSAAALANWHAAILGKTNMRPGIEPPEHADG